MGFERTNKTGGKFFGRKIPHPGGLALVCNGPSHGLGQMGFAQAGSRADKKGLHTAAALAHVLSSGHGHVVGRAHHQICKRIAPERRSRAVGGQGQGQGGLLCPARHARRRCSAFLEARRSAGVGYNCRAGGRRVGFAGAAVRRHPYLHGNGCGVQPQYGGRRLLQGGEHLVFQPVGYKGAGCCKLQTVHPHGGVERGNPNLENAGIKHFLEIFGNFCPLFLHAAL